MLTLFGASALTFMMLMYALERRHRLGIPDEKTIDAIRLCARPEGVLTDPVYEGKSRAALIDLVRSGRIAPGSRVLYAHLGGQPALNAYAGVF
jgi:1-aminocyclopropane-1-carboxylate deaminase